MTDDGDSMFSGEIFGVPFSALAAAAALILAAAAFFLRLYGSALDCSTAAFYKKNSENDSSASKRIAKYLDNDKYVFRALTGAGLSFAMSSALVCTFGSAKVYSLLYSALQGSGYAETLSGVLLAVISAAAISLMFAVFMYLPSALGRIHSDRIYVFLQRAAKPTTKSRSRLNRKFCRWSARERKTVLSRKTQRI